MESRPSPRLLLLSLIAVSFLQKVKGECSFITDTYTCQNLGSDDALDKALIDAAQYADQLTTILLQGGSITQLKKGALAKFTKLSMLRIEATKLQLVNAGAFDGVPGLKKLLLPNNKLTSVPNGLPSGLKALNMHKNQLRASTPVSDSIKGLTSLEELDLSSTGLTDEMLPGSPFSALSNLQELELSRNYINKVSNSLFKGLRKVKTLLIGRSWIYLIDDDAMKPLESMTTVDFSGNKLQTITIPVLRTLTGQESKLGLSFDLSGNPWSCSCHMLPVRTWIEGHGLQRFAKNMTCSNPEQTYGMNIMDVPREHFICKDPSLIGCCYNIRLQARTATARSCTGWGVPLPSISCSSPGGVMISASIQSAHDKRPFNNVALQFHNYNYEEVKLDYNCTVRNQDAATTRKCKWDSTRTSTGEATGLYGRVQIVITAFIIGIRFLRL